MAVIFDPEKDRANSAKHGLSLSRARDVDVQYREVDRRFDYAETRYRAWGLLDDLPCQLAFTVVDAICEQSA